MGRHIGNVLEALAELYAVSLQKYPKKQSTLLKQLLDYSFHGSIPDGVDTMQGDNGRINIAYWYNPSGIGRVESAKLLNCGREIDVFLISNGDGYLTETSNRFKEAMNKAGENMRCLGVGIHSNECCFSLSIDPELKSLKSFLEIMLKDESSMVII